MNKKIIGIWCSGQGGISIIHLEKIQLETPVVCIECERAITDHAIKITDELGDTYVVHEKCFCFKKEN